MSEDKAADEHKEYNAKVHENGKAYLRKSAEGAIGQLDIIIKNLTIRRDKFAALAPGNTIAAAVVAEAEAEIADALTDRAQIEAIMKPYSESEK